MTWEIAIPVRDRAESLVETAGHVRELPAEDRDFTRQLIISAYTDGIAESAGQLLAHLGGLTVGERRALLDRARTDCGLPSTESVDAGRAVEAASAAGLARMESMIQACHADGCNIVPTNEAGALREVDAVRWWCADHAHLAAPGDLAPRPAPWRLSPSGAIVANDPAADAAEAAAAESRASVEASKLAEAAVDAAALDSAERALTERMRRETPAGVPSP